VAAGKKAEWAEDPRYSHDPVRSMENYFGDLDQQLKAYFAAITIEEADRICRQAMVPGGPCNTVKELMTDEQAAARGMIITLEDPRLGFMRQLGRAAKFLREGGEADPPITPAPALGAHTVQALESIGLTSEEIASLGKAGVI
jgi:crotonobetainyl-CoA:carnitine CoA-transferase CaiB-like acyl-CoA transferase